MTNTTAETRATEQRFWLTCRCYERTSTLLDQRICPLCWRHAFLPRNDDGTVNCSLRAAG